MPLTFRQKVGNITLVVYGDSIFKLSQLYSRLFCWAALTFERNFILILPLFEHQWEQMTLGTRQGTYGQGGSFQRAESQRYYKASAVVVDPILHDERRGKGKEGGVILHFVRQSYSWFDSRASPYFALICILLVPSFSSDEKYKKKVAGAFLFRLKFHQVCVLYYSLEALLCLSPLLLMSIAGTAA